MALALKGKNFVVTGVTSGIGLATAEILVREGANLIGIARSAERCRETAQHLRSLNPNVQVDTSVADLSLQGDVRRAASDVRRILAGRGLKPLDGLVNNAGTFTYWLTLTAEGFETQWAVNHLAPFLLTHELLPLLKQAPTARVVTVSSESHYNTSLRWDDIQLIRRYHGLLAYNQSKLANILFTGELNRILREEAPNVHAFAADPGLVQTDIGFKGTSGLARWIWKQRRAAGIPPEEAARGLVYLLGEESIQNSKELYWRHGVPRKASRQALDVPSARRLWAVSELMCGIDEHEPQMA